MRAFLVTIIVSQLLVGCLSESTWSSRKFSDLIVKFVRHDLAAGPGLECVVTSERITLHITNDFGLPRKVLYDAVLSADARKKLVSGIRRSGLSDIHGGRVVVSEGTGKALAEMANMNGTLDRITIGRIASTSGRESDVKFYMFGNPAAARVVEVINAVLPTGVRIAALPLDWEPQTAEALRSVRSSDSGQTDHHGGRTKE